MAKQIGVSVQETDSVTRRLDDIYAALATLTVKVDVLTEGVKRVSRQARQQYALK